MVTQGVKGLIVIAEDGDAAVTSVDKAADAGVKVIAYDRLIKTSKIAAYLSFDNVEVGRQQALGVMTALGSPAAPPGPKTTPPRSSYSAGSPTDNNAILVHQGPDGNPPALHRLAASSRSWPTRGSITGMPPTPSR